MSIKVLAGDLTFICESPREAALLARYLREEQGPPVDEGADHVDLEPDGGGHRSSPKKKLANLSGKESRLVGALVQAGAAGLSGRNLADKIGLDNPRGIGPVVITIRSFIAQEFPEADFSEFIEKKRHRNSMTWIGGARIGELYRRLTGDELAF